MKREYLEGVIKVFFGGLCIVLWQLVSEIRSDVKLLLKGDAEKNIQIQNLDNRLKILENQGNRTPTRGPIVYWRKEATLPDGVYIKKMRS